jgi:hypothetical protein
VTLFDPLRVVLIDHKSLEKKKPPGLPGGFAKTVQLKDEILAFFTAEEG